MYLVTRTAVLAFMYIINRVIAAPSYASTQQSSINQSPALNITSNDTSLSAPPFPYYEEYRIPNTDLTLHLTLVHTLSREAMRSCLQTAFLWVSYQRQTKEMIPRQFVWKDSAGALFYVESLSRHLTWKEVGDVLKGLRQDLLDENRNFAARFTVEDRSEEQIIGKGRLDPYAPPEPDNSALLTTHPSLPPMAAIREELNHE